MRFACFKSGPVWRRWSAALVALAASFSACGANAAEAEGEGKTGLRGVRIVALIDDGFHPDETPQPIAHWEALGAEVILAGPRTGTARAAFGPMRLEMATTPDAVEAGTIDAIFIPGGTSPAKLAKQEAALDLVRRAMAADALIAAICHGPQVLIAAGVLEGRKATCVTVEARGYYAVRDALIAAGATYVDAPVVVDGNIVTSRVPDDVPVFQAAVAEELAKRGRR